MRRLFQEVLTRFRRAEESLRGFNVRFNNARFTDIPFHFPVPQVQIHLLVKLPDYGDRYIAEERIKYIFDFFSEEKHVYLRCRFFRFSSSDSPS